MEDAIEQNGPHCLTRYSVQTADQESLAIHRVGREPFASGRPVVVLLHGTYSNRRFWMSKKGKGLAGYLFSQGYDVWIPETRGHGDSPISERYKAWTIQDIIVQDLPAASTLIAQETADQRQHWIGHSYGGVYLALALASGQMSSSQVASVMTFGSQIREGQGYLRFAPVNWLFRAGITALGKFPARTLGMGAEDEPPQVMAEALHWKRRGAPVSRSGYDYLQGQQAIDLPVLAVAGSGDTIDPPNGCKQFCSDLPFKDKAFLELGREHGFREDYEHINMLIGSSAESEVWPRIAAWLAEKTDR